MKNVKNKGHPSNFSEMVRDPFNGSVHQGGEWGTYGTCVMQLEKQDRFGF